MITRFEDCFSITVDQMSAARGMALEIVSMGSLSVVKKTTQTVKDAESRNEE